MYIYKQDDSDEILIREIQNCSRRLFRKGAALHRLLAESEAATDAITKETLLQSFSDLERQAIVLDQTIDNLQREQRKRAGMRGIAIATCRAAWF